MSRARAKILIVDDHAPTLAQLAGLLEDEGYRTQAVASAAEAYAALQEARDPPAMMVLDIRMPGESGLELLARLPRPLPAPVVVLSGEASIADTVQALKLGATDFVEKPPTPERLLTAIQNALALRELDEERARLTEELAQPGHLIGDSAALEQLRRAIARVGPTDASVLITGETGTGKERVARALHRASGRRGRYVAVNCAAIPATLLESELFGHEKGAFTGAVARRIGRIEQAQRGTLLLDEIGDMPLELQAKLLRVLEEREVERLGGVAPVPVDARILASTHRDLEAEVAAGRFREDLFYRLNVFPLAVPPLRARPDDVLPLVRAFAVELVGPNVRVEIDAEAEALLRAAPWRGNVRELRNLVERLALLREGDAFVIAASALRGAGFAGGTASSDPGGRAGAAVALGQKTYRELVDDFERAVLTKALEQSSGNVAAAARLLGADRGNLYRRMKALGLVTGEDP
jgi:two-component system, NtrC family, nitrogen regulation response regulator NtrX